MPLNSPLYLCFFYSIYDWSLRYAQRNYQFLLFLIFISVCSFKLYLPNFFTMRMYVVDYPENAKVWIIYIRSCEFTTKVFFNCFLSSNFIINVTIFMTLGCIQLLVSSYGNASRSYVQE